jgi:hypothetical protein
MRLHNTLSTLDTLIGRLLLVGTRASIAAPTNIGAPAERALTFSLIFSGVRCTVQYVLLPFVLPLFGIVGGLSIGLVALIDLLALSSIIFSLRRFWQLRHPRRWEYLMFSLVILLVIALFLWDDFRRLSMPV